MKYGSTLVRTTQTIQRQYDLVWTSRDEVLNLLENYFEAYERNHSNQVIAARLTSEFMKLSESKKEDFVDRFPSFIRRKVISDEIDDPRIYMPWH